MHPYKTYIHDQQNSIMQNIDISSNETNFSQVDSASKNSFYIQGVIILCSFVFVLFYMTFFHEYSPKQVISMGFNLIIMPFIKLYQLIKHTHMKRLYQNNGNTSTQHLISINTISSIQQQ